MCLSRFFLLLGLLSLACAAPGKDDDDDDDDAPLCDIDAEGMLDAACAEQVTEACQDYFDAVETCFTAYGEANDVDMSGSLLSDTYCEETYGDVHDAQAAAYLSCLADAYDAVDCGEADAYASIDLSGCTMDGR